MPLDEVMRVAQITTREEFEEKLKSGKQLRIKLGIDPTSTSVHLGHTVVLRLLRKFQDIGHKAVLIIGDATACIGDPTGRTETRPTLSLGQARENAKTYLRQISKFVDIGKAEICYNSSWFEHFSFAHVLDLMSKVTVQQILNRNDFSDRMNKEVSISLHELIYPIMQAEDSVRVKADIELGGTEQLFNLMLGRDFQKAKGQSPQVCITLPILVGLDGEKKMGKSLGNFVGLDDDPLEMFSKIMSIPDNLMPQWFDLLTDVGQKFVTIDHDGRFGEKGSFISPMQTKKMLAIEIVKNCHTKDTALDVCKEWFQIHSERKDPTNIAEIKLVAPPPELPAFQLLFSCGLAGSKNEARRLIEGGGMTIGPDKQKVDDPLTMIPVVNGTIIRVGNRKVVQIKVDPNG